MTDFPTYRDLPGDWIESAACRQHDPEAWFPMSTPGRSNVQRAAELARKTDEAVAICLRCPVRRKCLTTALEHERTHGTESIHGIYGGLGPDQRAALIRKERADVA